MAQNQPDEHDEVVGAPVKTFSAIFRSTMYGFAVTLMFGCLDLLSIWRNDPSAKGGVLWWLMIGLVVLSVLQLLILGSARVWDRARRGIQ